MVLRSGLYLALCFYMTLPVLSEQKHCSSHRDCHGKWRICHFDLEGCSLGKCTCDPARSFLDSKGKCQTLEYCDANKLCPRGKTCHDNSCICEHVAIKPGGRLCLSERPLALGDRCNPSDTCHHTISNGLYKSLPAYCSQAGTCQCSPGFKEDRGRCVLLSVGESGCKESYHCQAGALCIDSICQCPQGYTARGTKCIKSSAVYDLLMGSVCDEQGETAYCAAGLICTTCGAGGRTKCLRHEDVSVLRARYINGATSCLIQLNVLVVCFLAMVARVLSTSIL